jgi:hypothetical protein
VGKFVHDPFLGLGWIGDEGEDCPVCKAHGIHPGAEGPILLPILPQELMSCACPLCRMARFDPEEN